MRTSQFSGVSVVCLMMLVGCGGEEPSKYPSARLEGAVTVDGRPIPQGTIQFMPLDPAAGSATQAAIKDGRYVAERVPRGQITAILSATDAGGPPASTTRDGGIPGVTSLIPAANRSGIRIEVDRDRADQDFILTSARVKPRR